MYQTLVRASEFNDLLIKSKHGEPRKLLTEIPTNLIHTLSWAKILDALGTADMASVWQPRHSNNSSLGHTQVTGTGHAPHGPRGAEPERNSGKCGNFVTPSFNACKMASSIDRGRNRE